MPMSVSELCRASTVPGSSHASTAAQSASGASPVTPWRALGAEGMQSAPALSTQVTNCAVLRIHTTPNRKKHRVPQGQATPIRTESGSARSRRHPACGYRLPDAQTRCPRLRRPLSSCGRLRMVQTKSSYRKRPPPQHGPLVLARCWPHSYSAASADYAEADAAIVAREQFGVSSADATNRKQSRAGQPT